MPSGLDGNPDPIVSARRDAVLAAVVGSVADVAARSSRVIVGVDGRSGVGKSTFADEIRARLEADGVVVVRSTTDSFHRPRAERLRRGPASAEGFFLDSHQLDRFASELLVPFRRGDASVLVTAFDEPSDRPRLAYAEVAERAVLVVDGLFLHRHELRGFWDLSILLTGDARPDAQWLDFLLSDLPTDAAQRAAELDRRLERARWPRYWLGWAHYLDRDTPAERASFVIDNDDLTAPRMLRGGVPS